MLRKLRKLYHDTAATALLTRMFFTDILCPNCTFDEESGLEIRCDKHHEKQFDREGRAYEHFERTFD